MRNVVPTLGLAGIALGLIAWTGSVVWVAPATRAQNSASTSPAFSAALQSVHGNEIRKHMEVLAADDMQGREAGTEPYLAAAEYVAAQFNAAGLEPLGDDGTYLQHVRFMETRLVPELASFTLTRGATTVSLQLRDDFVRRGSFGEPEETVEAPLCFAGFGITAPEYAHDDFEGIDVRDKILVVFTGAPPSFDTDQRAFYSSSDGKRERALERGALGIVLVRTPVDQKRWPWSRTVSGVGSASLRWVDAQGAPRDGFPQLVGDASLSESGARKLFELAGRDLDALFEHHMSGATGSFDLSVTARLQRRSKQRTVTSPNVIARLRGSDPALRDEHIIYTAHLDHLGIRPDPSGDTIHNGAYDNAVGVSAVIVIGKALSAMSPAPRRSILFVALTAEEKGLRGSNYLAHNPPVPIENVVANLNIDMPFLGYPIADVEPIGVEHSTLHDAVTRAAAHLGLAVTPDPRPELVRFIRSDQFSFVKRGIPGLNLKPGVTTTDPNIDGAAMRAEFLSEHYHRASDDLTLPFSHEGAETFVRTALALGLIVASDDDPPRWKENDFFGERFGRGRTQRSGVVHGER